MELSDDRINRDCLLVVLRPALTLGLGLRWPIEAFQIDSTTYRDTGLGEWTGFYDWIRRADGEIIGVRYWPAEDNQPLLEAVRALEYVVIGDAGCVEIHFRPETADPTRSNDQEFQYDAVFRSSTGGEWAIAFDTAALTEADVASLRRLDATWIAAIPALITMKFDQPEHHSRDALTRELASNDQSRISRALIVAAQNESDRLYVESLIEQFLSHPDPWVRGIAALAAGHVARIHRSLTVDRLVPLIEQLLADADPETRGKAQDALDDIQMFLVKLKPNEY